MTQVQHEEGYKDISAQLFSQKLDSIENFHGCYVPYELLTLSYQPSAAAVIALDCA